MLPIVSILFGWVVATSSTTVSPFVALENWTPMQHDVFVADTETNMGYIVHDNGLYTAFRIGSGEQKTVHYMGLTYDASTPLGYWQVKSTTIQSDRIDFGPTGFFLRLYKNGSDETSYGIHATANINDILAGDDRYKSLGCILVSQKVLDVLAKTYQLNGDELDVVTAYGIHSMLGTQANG